LGSYLFSLFLAVLTGYGYRLFRIALAYVLANVLFGTLYWSLTIHHPHPINFWEALITSVQVFHGRIFNPFDLPLPDPRVIISTVEAMVGLILEATFIAMLTQRFFNR